MNKEEWEAKFKNDYEQAKKKDGKLHKVCAGFYLVWYNEEMLQISKNTERDSSWYNQWMIEEWKGKWYSDPFKTLKEAKGVLGIS